MADYARRLLFRLAVLACSDIIYLKKIYWNFVADIFTEFPALFANDQLALRRLSARSPRVVQSPID